MSITRKPYTGQLLFFTLCLLFLGEATVPATGGAVDYLERMGVSRINATVDAPDFILPDLAGRRRHLREFRGKFVMLNFWATW